VRPAGAGQKLALAPAIAALPQWYSVPQLHYFRSGGRGMHPDDVGGLRMHPMSLTLKHDADIADVSAYVASLSETFPAPVVEGGDAQRGAQRYALCAACHGANGAGNEQMKAPRLVGTNDWYLVSTLQKFKAGIRGANPENPNGAVMRSFASQLDEQAILDVVAYISTLSGR
jgi:cytochrome c553